MNTTIEQKLIALQEDREQRQTSKPWFATLPSKCITVSSVMEENQKRRIKVAEPDRKKDHRAYTRKYRNTEEFMIANFATLDELIPEKEGMTIGERTDKIEAVIMNYKNNGNFLRSMDHEYLWKCLQKKFLVNYWSIKKDSERITQGLPGA